MRFLGCALAVMAVLAVSAPSSPEACCDSMPQEELAVSSAGGRHAALFTPSLTSRTVHGVTFLTYGPCRLTLGVRDSPANPFRSLWRIEVPDPGSDTFRLAVSDHGYVALFSHSSLSLTAPPALRCFGPDGSPRAELRRSSLPLECPDGSPLRLGGVEVAFTGDVLAVTGCGAVLAALDCESGRLVTGLSAGK